DDGRFVAVARMIDFIARDRTTPREERAAYKINPLALVEYVHDFVMTYKALVEHFDPQPAEARFAIAVLSATGTPSGDLFLPAGGVESLDWMVGFNAQLPDMAKFAWEYEASLNADPGAIALPLLERVYAYFKNTAESIPYLNDERTAVNPELFSKARR